MTPFHQGGIHIDLIRLNSKVANSGFVNRKLFLSGWGMIESETLPEYLRYTVSRMIGATYGNLDFGGLLVDRGICGGDSGGIVIDGILNKRPSG